MSVAAAVGTDGLEETAVTVEFLDPVVTRIGDPDVARAVDGHAADSVELAVAAAVAADRTHQVVSRRLGRERSRQHGRHEAQEARGRQPCHSGTASHRESVEHRSSPRISNGRICRTHGCEPPQTTRIFRTGSARRGVTKGSRQLTRILRSYRDASRRAKSCGISVVRRVAVGIRTYSGSLPPMGRFCKQPHDVTLYNL